MFNRTHWAARFLGIRTPAGEAEAPGLIIIQIDGLSRTQMERAVKSGRLPFIARAISRGHLTVENFYSGLPSTTPAVQGEVFYGVRAAVPSFEFLHRQSGRVFRMTEADSAATIEHDLEKQCANPLLMGGRAYSNIFRGGAEISHYCGRDLDPCKLFKRLKPLRALLLCILFAPKILRMIGLAFLELALAILDMFRGLYEREDLLKELAFVPSRVLICIVLREMIRFHVLLDIESGVQVIHANFLGYDEQAHRRGPDSSFAHWTLKGIDRAVRDICQAAGHSAYRDYEWIIHSDHGQERTVPYERKHGHDIDAALREVFSRGPLAGFEVWVNGVPQIVGTALERCRAFFGLRPPCHGLTAPVAPDTQIVFTALGPVGHLYFPKMPGRDAVEAYARDLVASARVPLVLLECPDKSVKAWNARGMWTLPEDSAEILGARHPFPEEAAADLQLLCQHHDAGDLVLCGWDPDEPLSFSMENGAHGGPGYEETRGFLLVPDRIRHWHIGHLRKTRSRVRGEDLRKIAIHFLARDAPREERVAVHCKRDDETSVRVMTYNIHSCIGLDGKTRPERVARVINHCDPDIVAVQEIDAHRARSGGHHQAEMIADHLRMTHVFHAMLEEEKERYGIAIFSRHPFDLIKSEILTKPHAKSRREARGAIWVTVEFGGRTVNFINTHFGLGRAERRQQVMELLGERWLGGHARHEPVILCGDFNSGPRSEVFRLLRTHFRDAQEEAEGHRPRPTFSTFQPLVRIDHVFFSSQFTVWNVELPDTPTARIASDHLPLCAELQFLPEHEDA